MFRENTFEDVRSFVRSTRGLQSLDNTEIPHPMLRCTLHRLRIGLSRVPQHRANYTGAIDGVFDAKVINDYAKKNADLARRALQVPDATIIPSSSSSSLDQSESSASVNTNTEKPFSLNDYLKWRQWDSAYIDNTMTNALISHAMTFPLTLAYNAHHFILPHHQQESLNMQSTPSQCNIRLCCVGSRAEANLPDDYWKEFLICSNLLGNAYDNTNTNANATVHWTIDCVGPEVSRQMKSRQITLDIPDSNGSKNSHTSLTLNYHSGYLHNYILDMYKSSGKSIDDILTMFDGFILFNPGIGHPHLKKSWKPTMEFILKTKQRFIMTAHSEMDSERDRMVLYELMGFEENTDALNYTLNPFASKMSFEDPFSETVHLVRPNYSILRG